MSTAVEHVQEKKKKTKQVFPNAKRPMLFSLSSHALTLTTFSPKTDETDEMMDRPPQNQTNTPAKREAHCLKISQNVAFEFFNFGIFHQFLTYKTDLSGNTV